MTRISRALLVSALAAAALTFTGGTQASGDVAQADVVVKVAAGHTIGEVAAEFPIEVRSAVLASRGIYLVRSTAAMPGDDASKVAYRAEQLARTLETSDAVIYAEPDYLTTLADTRYHAWPDGNPADAGTDPAVWTGQAATRSLALAQAHTRSTGAGTLVAVLDSGVDAAHPALAGRLQPGWDYVDDDADPADIATGLDPDADGIPDDAYGHGTFVAGLVALVAPDARIMPARVLDSDGRGSVFLTTEAIMDAVDAGADVINLSLGTTGRIPSRLLADTVWHATSRGTIVIAASGNNRDNRPTYPAADAGVLGVSALAASGTQLATFASWGGWIDVAAPGERVAGPVPGARYAWWSGTSMATAFVAGQAALLYATTPAPDATKVTTAITRTSTRIPGSRTTAFGAINIPASLAFR